MVHSILFLVGKQSDEYPIKYTSRRAPLWLREGARTFSDYVNEDDHTVPSDVAMAMFMQHRWSRSRIDCLLGDEAVSARRLNPYDMVVVVYDAIEVFHCGGRARTCPRLATRMERALATTSAFVVPYPKFHKYIITKPRYYRDLEEANIPVAPFLRITPAAALSDVASLKAKLLAKEWKGAIIKPSYAGYSMGIRVLKDIRRTKVRTIRAHFQRLQRYGFPNVTIQEFVPSFGKHHEIRTYWLEGRYAYSVATLTDAVGGEGGLSINEYDTFVSEGGSLPDSVKRELKILGREVLQALPQYPYPHPLLRIDFGCCLATADDCSNTYFVNEVETMACNLLASHTTYPIVEKLAGALYRFCGRVKGKVEPRAVPSDHYYDTPTCVQPT